MDLVFFQIGLSSVYHPYLVTKQLIGSNAIRRKEVKLCWLSVAYACPYHNPTATMGKSVHSFDISKPLAHTTLYTRSVVVKQVGRTAKFSNLEVAHGREMYIQFSGNSSGGHSCTQHANCMPSQNLRHLWHCVV